MAVTVVTDSVASIPAAQAAGLGMCVVPLQVNDRGEARPETDIDLDSFYARLADTQVLPTTSQPSPEALSAAFRAAFEQAHDVVGVFISEKMSGTLQSARLAAQMLAEEFPLRRVALVDSRSNSMEEGMAALSAATLAQAGAAVDDCVAGALETMRRTRYLFAPHSLEYLRRGGRIGQASALVGQLLQIVPVLTVKEGETATYARVRTSKRALAEIARTFGEDMGALGLRRVVVHYIADKAGAERFAAEHIQPLVGGGPVEVIPVSPVIGVHVGPAIGIVYETENELTK